MSAKSFKKKEKTENAFLKINEKPKEREKGVATKKFISPNPFSFLVATKSRQARKHTTSTNKRL